MKKLMIIAIIALTLCSCCEFRGKDPRGIYVSTIMERDTLYLYCDSGYIPNSSYPYSGKYERHIVINDTLKINHGKWYYDYDLKNIAFHNWINYGELRGGGSTVYYNKYEVPYIVLAVCKNFCDAVEFLDANVEDNIYKRIE